MDTDDLRSLSMADLLKRHNQELDAYGRDMATLAAALGELLGSPFTEHGRVCERMRSALTAMEESRGTLLATLDEAARRVES